MVIMHLQARLRAHEWVNKVEQPGGEAFSAESREDQNDDDQNTEEEKKTNEEERHDDKRSIEGEEAKDGDLRTVEVKDFNLEASSIA